MRKLQGLDSKSTTVRRGLHVAVALAALAAGVTATPRAHAAFVMTSAQKKAKMLDILDKFVKRTEQFWCDNGDTGGPCDPELESTNSDGYFAANGPGVSLIRGEGEVAFLYATLLTAFPACTSPGVPAGCRNTIGGKSRGVLLNHAEEAIRHAAFTNTLFYSGGEPLEWGGAGEWQGSPMTYNWAWAAQLLWNQLGSSTRSAVTQVVKQEANTQVYDKDPLGRVGGDTHAEDNAWNTGILAAAAAMYKTDSHFNDWIFGAKEFAVNAFMRPSDSSNNELVDGTKVKVWQAIDPTNGSLVVNLNEDLSLVNHRFFHPTYLQGLYQSLSDSANFLKAVNITVPQALTYRAGLIWDEILGPLMTDDGDIVHPAGTDWVRHDFQHLTTLSVLSVRLGRHDASVYESRAIDLLAARQAAQSNNSLFGMTALGYEADVARNIAGAYWTHQLFGSAPTPTQAQFDSARAPMMGVRDLPDAQAIINTRPAATVTMIWEDKSSAEPSIQFVPSSASNLGDPVFMAALPKSGFHLTPGENVTYNWEIDSNYFSTAGTASSTPETRHMSVTSFPDGTVLLLDRAVGTVTNGRTFNFGFETIPGLTPSRLVYGSDFTGLGDHSGNWLNIADRFGIVVVGGGGLTAFQTPPDSDGVNSNIEIEGSKSLGTGYRVALVLPNVAHGSMSALASEVRKLTAPSSWGAMTARAPDGSERIAVGRWGGSSGATFTLTTGIGAPIFAQTTSVDGNNGSATYNLSLVPSSTGSATRFYLSSTAGKPLSVTRLSDERIKIKNNGSSASTATIGYASSLSSIASTSRPVSAGQTQFAVRLSMAPGVALVLPGASTTESPGTTYPPHLAFDGDTTSSGNFWVSAPVNLSTNHQMLTLDYGANVPMSKVTMIPRTNYGPKSFIVETMADGGSTWTQRGSSAVNVPNGSAVLVSFPRVNARYVRINISDCYGSSAPIQQPQVRELVVEQ